MPRLRNKEGYYIGALYTCERQCGYPDCESWNTLALVIVGVRDENIAEWEYPFCYTHLEQFIKDYVFGSTTNLILRPDGTVEE